MTNWVTYTKFSEEIYRKGNNEIGVLRYEVRGETELKIEMGKESS